MPRRLAACRVGGHRSDVSGSVERVLRPLYNFGVTPLAHGGAVGLAIELGLVLVLLALGVRVWWQSKALDDAEDAGESDAEPAVDEADESAVAGRR